MTSINLGYEVILIHNLTSYIRIITFQTICKQNEHVQNRISQEVIESIFSSINLK